MKFQLKSLPNISMAELMLSSSWVPGYIYVEDIEDRSNTPKGCNAIYLSKMLKMGKEHTYTFLLITFLIFNQFSICKKFWKAET